MFDTAEITELFRRHWSLKLKAVSNWGFKPREKTGPELLSTNILLHPWINLEFAYRQIILSMTKVPQYQKYKLKRKIALKLDYSLL